MMNIKGDKVLLRALELKDCDMLLKLINDPETERMLGGYSFPVSAIEQENWLINHAKSSNTFRCAVVPFDNDDIAVGTVILSDIDMKNATAEIHIKLDADLGRGRGYGTDAVNALVKYGFTELRLNCIYSNVIEYNNNSKALFEKCGFECEGVLHSRIYKDGSYFNIVSYSIRNA